jgi:hypothetical protein
MEIIDTHQHLWDMDLFSYTWCKDYPALNHSFRMEDYLEAIRGMQLEKSVHIEADVDEPYMLEETRHIFKLADPVPLAPKGMREGTSGRSHPVPRPLAHQRVLLSHHVLAYYWPCKEAAKFACLKFARASFSTYC